MPGHDLYYSLHSSLSLSKMVCFLSRYSFWDITLWHWTWACFSYMCVFYLEQGLTHNRCTKILFST